MLKRRGQGFFAHTQSRTRYEATHLFGEEFGVFLGYQIFLAVLSWEYWYSESGVWLVAMATTRYWPDPLGLTAEAGVARA